MPFSLPVYLLCVFYVFLNVALLNCFCLEARNCHAKKFFQLFANNNWKKINQISGEISFPVSRSLPLCFSNLTSSHLYNYSIYNKFMTSSANEIRNHEALQHSNCNFLSNRKELNYKGNIPSTFFKGLRSVYKRRWEAGILNHSMKCAIYSSYQKSGENARVELVEKPNAKIRLLHRMIAAFSYVLPLVDTLQGFLVPVVTKFSGSRKILTPIGHALSIYSSIPFLSFTVFMGTYLIFVRKNIFDLPYFVKYNVMQSLIMSIFQYATTMIYFRIFPFNHAEDSPFTDTMMLTLVFSGLGMILKTFLTSLLGMYPVIPVISEAVNMHIGDKPQTLED